MFAVLKTGGKQYKVSKNDVIVVEKLTAVPGDIIQFDQILMIANPTLQVGTPLINGAFVRAEVVEQAKNKKVISFVKRRRKHSSQRTRGHRQNVTVLRVSDILASGAETGGAKIEVGATVVGSIPKAVVKPAAKAETAKKPAAKAATVKKSVAKAETVKKPAAKAETVKKPAAKAETAKKLAAKAETAKKPAAKAETAKKPAAKAETAKKPAAKKPIKTIKS
jgi:large subunit ribosomal protein L21